MNKKYLLFFLLFMICLFSFNAVSATSDMASDSGMLGADLSDLDLEESDADLGGFDLNSFEAEASGDNNLKESSMDSSSNLAFDDSKNLGESDSSIVKDEEKLSSKIISANKKVYYSNMSTYSIRLLGNNSKPISNQMIFINVLGEVYNSTTDENGYARLNIFLEPGTYVIDSSYAGNEVYNASSFMEYFTIYPSILSSDLNVYTTNREAFIVKVVDASGHPIYNVSVSFNIAGENYTTSTNYLGQAQLFINLDEGIYNITTTANGFSVDNIIKVIQKSFTVTPLNFYHYFNSDNSLKEEYSDSVLTFQGRFEEFGIIDISQPAMIKGVNASFINTVFKISSSKVYLDNVSLFLNKEFKDNGYAGVFLDANNVTISNVYVNYTAPLSSSAMGICVGSEYDDHNTINLLNNTIDFVVDAEATGDYYWPLVVYNVPGAVVTGNTINAEMPARNVRWAPNGPYGGVQMDSVAGLSISGCDNLIFKNNQVHVLANNKGENYLTLDAIIIYECNDGLMYNNTITEGNYVTPPEDPIYLIALDVYRCNNLALIENNIHVNTTAGRIKSNGLGEGTAYCIQATGPISNFTIAYNNLTTSNYGPNLAIYSQNYYGSTELIVFSNLIDVTGKSSNNNWGLVSGMELQDNNVTVLNNTIRVHDRSNSTSGHSYGISYKQSTAGSHTYNIQYNTIITDSQYSVNMGTSGSSVVNSIIANNVLISGTSEGNKAARFIGGYNNTIKNNTGNVLNQIGMPSDMIPDRIKQILGIITDVNSDGAGFSNKTGNSTGIIDNGGNEGVGNGTGNGVVNSNSANRGNGESDNRGASQSAKFNGTGDFDFGQTQKNSNSNAPGISGEALSSSLSSSEAGKSGASAASPHAYEINKTKDIASIKSTDNDALKILLVVFALICLLVGYKRQNYE